MLGALKMNEYKQMFAYLNHPDVPKEDKIDRLNKLSIYKLEEYHSEITGEKRYVKLLDGCGIAFAKYPLALEILTNVIDLKIYQGEKEKEKEKSNVTIIDKPKETAQDKHIKYLKQRDEFKRKKEAAAAKAKLIESKRIIESVTQIIKSDLDVNAKATEIRRCLR